MNRNCAVLAMMVAAGLAANTRTFAADPADQPMYPNEPPRSMSPAGTEPSALPGPNDALLASSKIIGQPVENDRGEKLGEIHDLMISADTGRIEYCLVNVGGGFLGVGRKDVALPWSEFKQNSSHRGFVLAMTRDALAQAPRFDRAAWEKRQYETTAGPAGIESERPSRSAPESTKVERFRGTVQEVNADNHTVSVKRLLTIHTFQIDSARADELSNLKPGNEVDVWYRDQNGTKTIQDIRAVSREDEPATQPEPE